MRRWLVLVTVVVVRWSRHLNVIFIMFGICFVSLVNFYNRWWTSITRVKIKAPDKVRVIQNPHLNTIDFHLATNTIWNDSNCETQLKCGKAPPALTSSHVQTINTSWCEPAGMYATHRAPRRLIIKHTYTRQGIAYQV